MYTVLKKSFPVQACRLGEDSPLLKRLMEEKKIVAVGPGQYQVFSVETDGVKGELACDGDFVKLDVNGEVYPNRADFFLHKHKQIGENTYVQEEQRLLAWDAQEPMCDEIAFLLEKKGLVINQQSDDHYYSAPLWGTALFAARDAVIIFYSISRDKQGRIMYADYNFVERRVFDKTYERIG